MRCRDQSSEEIEKNLFFRGDALRRKDVIGNPLAVSTRTSL